MCLPFRAVFLTLVLVAVPLPALAWDCDFYEHCCMEYAAAMQEKGSPDFALEDLEFGCHMHRDMPPGIREHFCFEAWFAIGEEINEQYERGIIDFVPESCPQGIASPEDEVLIPGPDLSEPPEEEEEMPGS